MLQPSPNFTASELHLLFRIVQRLELSLTDVSCTRCGLWLEGLYNSLCCHSASCVSYGRAPKPLISVLRTGSLCLYHFQSEEHHRCVFQKEINHLKSVPCRWSFLGLRFISAASLCHQPNTVHLGMLWSGRRPVWFTHTPSSHQPFPFPLHL